MSESKDIEQIENAESRHTRRSVLKMLSGVPVLGFLSYEFMRKKSYDKGKGVELIKELGLDKLNVNQAVPKSVDGKLLRIGIIGYGTRAEQLARGLGYIHPDAMLSLEEKGRLDDWLQQDSLNIAITGICDVFDLHAERGIKTAENKVVAGSVPHPGKPVRRYSSYREMLADDSIDAVIIATPDHHHARMSIDAIQAGKHVYCEKSVCMTEEELNELYYAVRNSDRIYQLGHQITQNIVFQQAKEIIAKDVLGKITLVETTANRNNANGAWIRHLDADGKPKPGNLATIDWEQWLGSSPKVPFSVDRFYNWTKFFDYDTGMLGQLFSHEYDAVNQLLRIGIPNSAISSGGIYYWKDNREIPDTLHSVFEYPDKEMTLTFSASLASSLRRGRVFMGHDASMELGRTVSIRADYNSTKYKKGIQNGIIEVGSPMLTINPGSGEIDAVTSASEKYYASRGLTSTTINGRPVDLTHLHLKEWLECIHNGREPSGNIERAFEEGITILMAHKSYLEKRKVNWDPIKRKII